MVATRAQRAQTKDEPAATKRAGALKEPARRGKKKVETEEPAPAPAAKPTRAAAATTTTTTTKKATKPAAAKPAATRRTRAQDADAPAPAAADDPAVEDPAPAKPARKTAAKAAAKPAGAAAATTTTTATRKRPARDVEPETVRPAKRQTRGRAAAEPEEEPEEAEAEAEAPPAAKRATRATRGTKASETRSAAAVKPLAQRITVTAKRSTRKAREEAVEPAVPEVEMEDVEEAPTPAPAKSTRKSARKAASEEPEQLVAAEEAATVEPTPAKSAKRASKRKALEEVPEVPAEDVEMEENEEPAPETPVKPAKKNAAKTAEVEEAPAEHLENEPEAEQDATEEPSVATPVQTPQAPQQQPETPAKPTPAPPKSVRPEMKENVPPKTPGPAHYAAAMPFAQEATPFFRPEQAPKTVSLQARTPGLNKSLLHETPRKAPMGTPFKLAPMSAAKPSISEANTGSILNSPAKRAPFAASIHGTTPMKPSAANPDFKSSFLHTPAKKGLMLPPSTAPVNKHGFQPAQAKSSLFQTCPRKIALPGLPPKSSMTSPTKAGEGSMGSSLLSATPRKVRIESPAKPAFGSSVQDFAFQAQNSVLGAEPRRWHTPAKTPAKRFATPGKTPAKSLVDADAGSPTPVKKTPAGLKDVNSALRLLNEASPAMPPATPTEQFMMNVIDKLDQSISESESVQEEELGSQNHDIEVARSAEEPESQDDQDDITADLELQQPDAEEMEQCVSPADLVMSDSETPAGSPAPEAVEDVTMDEQVDAPQQESTYDEHVESEQLAAEDAAQDAPQMETITEESSILEQHEEYVEATPARPEIEFIEESHEVEEEFEQPTVAFEVVPTVQEQPEVEQVHEKAEMTTTVVKEVIEETTVTQVPERPSTPTMEDQHIAALAKEKAKTERRARHKRLSMAIELENSIKKPRKSLAFIPSLTPAKSALRSPFKRPFGSPKKSVAWAMEPAVPKIVEEIQQPQTPKAVEQQVEADLEIHIPRPDDRLLNGTVFFVDVRTADGEDAGDLFIPLLEEMGAKIVSTWSGVDGDVTHVLYKDGSVETLDKVATTQGAVKAVNIGWVLDCERFNKWVAEEAYLLDLSRLAGNSPARALVSLSTNNTPARASPAKSAFGTPFALMHLTPKAKPTLSPFADITPQPAASPADKENTTPSSVLAFRTPTKAPPAAAAEFSPSTPYYLHPQNLVQKTCPPKQLNRGLFEADVRSEMAVTPFRQKMLLARRSLSPAAFGRAVEM
ncbi:brct domain-containing protein [Neofusicoccum parvum]|nr:brct domain-containing protein [Neofusicoccum parvum]